MVIYSNTFVTGPISISAQEAYDFLSILREDEEKIKAYMKLIEFEKVKAHVEYNHKQTSLRMGK